MQRRDWLVTGLRLVGVFVAIHGLAGVAQAIAWLGVEAWDQSRAGALPREFRLGFHRLPSPLAETLLGWLTIRLAERVATWCGEPPPPE